MCKSSEANSKSRMVQSGDVSDLNQRAREIGFTLTSKEQEAFGKIFNTSPSDVSLAEIISNHSSAKLSQ
ncbi:hypothetical protein NB550_11035 [Vibrio parahaemolyticus]|jgi:hypothetical protein|uniref:hypothetical protein n=1 Tax=Vibrio TaxID=662 RepID=UPI0011101C0D|nr:hypothetical protein [Vibrio parahaemolyticus]MCR9888093.1 hypothetical protein [Vibrio parahaemolyticus]MCR9918023.1 hypothetical protein [Vibrio parahaemolyticus]TMX39660.1 hypothetical protein DA098_10250 [Vibrio parahaemolyticus]TMX80274.1 hypothetical protein DA094_01730 [Vibrio parahaemolyticus]WHT06086.1 hypothetical protein O2T11_25900 [Vibrio parahaemolyticus]